MMSKMNTFLKLRITAHYKHQGQDMKDYLPKWKADIREKSGILNFK